MADQVMRSSKRLIDEFVVGLSELEGLDEDVVKLIRGLHQRGHLNSRNLLRQLENQRKEWERAETP